MKRTIPCLLALLLSLPASAANVYLYVGATGQTLYGRVEETAGNFVAFALTEGTGGAKGKYYATEANIVAAGLDTAGTFLLTVHYGATPSTTAEDPIVAYDNEFGWTAAAYRDSPARLLATTNGAASVATQLARLDAAVSSVDDAMLVSAYLVDADHSWRFQGRTQVTSPDILTENIGFVGLLQMDFTEPIPASASIASITSTSVADVGGSTEPTISSSALSADKRKVVLTINAASATAATYTFTVTIVTTDSQTYVRKGRLTIQ